MDILKLIGRENNLFKNDISTDENKLISSSSFLVLGGAVSIRKAVLKRF